MDNSQNSSQFFEKKSRTQIIPSEVVSLSFMQCDWGPINQSFLIQNPLELEQRFGMYREEYDYLSTQTTAVSVGEVVLVADTHTAGGIKNHLYRRITSNLGSTDLSTIDFTGALWINISNEDAWMNIRNHLAYNQNTKIFRVGSTTNSPTFSGTTLIGVSGSSHSHKFFGLKSSPAISVWDSAINGSNLYQHINDRESESNLPSFGATQLLFAVAKYCGVLGDKIGLSIASYPDVLSEKYVFKFTELTVASIAGFSIGQTITSSSGGTGIIKQIEGNILSIELYSGTFIISDTITDGITTTTINGIEAADDVDYNPCMQDITPRQLQLNEFLVVLTLNDVIIFTEVLSTNSNATNFCERYDNDYIQFYCNDTIVPADSNTDPADYNDYHVVSCSNEKLQFGCNDQLNTSEVLTQLELLDDMETNDYDVLFFNIEEYELEDYLAFLEDFVKNEERIIVYSINQR